jgi:hypothetical protein
MRSKKRVSLTQFNNTCPNKKRKEKNTHNESFENPLDKENYNLPVDNVTTKIFFIILTFPLWIERQFEHINRYKK